MAGAMIVAFATLVPSVFAASPKPFHLDKTCASDVLCTVVSSDFKWIPADTDVTYVTDWDNWLTYPTIAVRNGSTTGVCDWNQPPGEVLAKCSFGDGTGRLTSFHLAVDVTVTGDPSSPDAMWHWDGFYDF